jgi:hypothetical protein
MSYEIVVDFRDNDDGERYTNDTRIEVSVGDVEKSFWEAEGADDLRFTDDSTSNDNLDGSPLTPEDRPPGRKLAPEDLTA